MSPFWGTFWRLEGLSEVSKWEVVRTVAEGKERMLRKGNGQVIQTDEKEV